MSPISAKHYNAPGKKSKTFEYINFMNTWKYMTPNFTSSGSNLLNFEM